MSFATDVSIFALNLTTAMGLALAIDYTLLMISRFRDELADGASREDALMRATSWPAAPLRSPRQRSAYRWRSWCCSPCTS
jgi:uncharacterized membrane protein YdfJ with MMPL/SSD domain